MQTEQGNMLQSLRTVQGFLYDNAAKLAGVVSTGASKKLDEAITELAGHASDQTGGALAAKGSTRKQKALRVALLRDHMAPIARIARAELPQTPGIEPLRMPRGRPTVEKLAAAATGMAQTAEPFAEVFISAGLSADFIAQLRGAADALLLSLSERSQNRGRSKGATTGLKAKLSAGRKIVHVLDAFVKSAAKDDAALLTNWNMVKRVPKVMGRAAAGTSQPAAHPGTPKPTVVPDAGTPEPDTVADVVAGTPTAGVTESASAAA